MCVCVCFCVCEVMCGRCVWSGLSSHPPPPSRLHCPTSVPRACRLTHTLRAHAPIRPHVASFSDVGWVWCGVVRTARLLWICVTRLTRTVNVALFSKRPLREPANRRCESTTAFRALLPTSRAHRASLPVLRVCLCLSFSLASFLSISLMFSSSLLHLSVSPPPSTPMRLPPPPPQSVLECMCVALGGLVALTC